MIWKKKDSVHLNERPFDKLCTLCTQYTKFDEWPWQTNSYNTNVIWMVAVSGICLGFYLSLEWKTINTFYPITIFSAWFSYKMRSLFWMSWHLNAHGKFSGKELAYLTLSSHEWSHTQISELVRISNRWQFGKFGAGASLFTLVSHSQNAF